MRSINKIGSSMTHPILIMALIRVAHLVSNLIRNVVILPILMDILSLFLHFASQC